MAGNEIGFAVRDITNGSNVPLSIRPQAPSNAVFIDHDGDVGLGTSSPSGDLHVRDTAGGDDVDLDLEVGGQSWRWRADATNGEMKIINNTSGATVVRIDVDAPEDLLTLGVQAADVVEVTGNLFVNDTQLTVPDFVFEADYELESIAEHADYMWREKHLPGVGAGQAKVNVGALSYGILEELEKAHIYIEQLHTRLEEKRGHIDALRHRLTRVEELLSSKRGLVPQARQ